MSSGIGEHAGSHFHIAYSARRWSSFYLTPSWRHLLAAENLWRSEFVTAAFELLRNISFTLPIWCGRLHDLLSAYFDFDGAPDDNSQPHFDDSHWHFPFT